MMFTSTDIAIRTANDYLNAVSSLLVPMSKFDMMRPLNFHKGLKTSVRIFPVSFCSSFTHRIQKTMAHIYRIRAKGTISVQAHTETFLKNKQT